MKVYTCEKKKEKAKDEGAHRSVYIQYKQKQAKRQHYNVENGNQMKPHAIYTLANSTLLKYYKKEKKNIYDVRSYTLHF